MAKVAQLAPMEEGEEAVDGQDGGEPPTPDAYARSAAPPPAREEGRDDSLPSPLVTAGRRTAARIAPTSRLVAMAFVCSTSLRAYGC